MKAWLEFSKTYMTNPPEEAKNDRAWVQKTTYAAKSIGEIRHDILKGSFYEAHNKVLALSGYLAKFFEGFGISEEKQIFMTASTNLISLERALLENNRAEAASFSSALKTDLSSFDTMLKGDNGKGTSKARSLLAKIDAGLKDSEHLKRLDGQFVKLQAVFEEMRSEILLQEWFPSAKKEGGKQ